MIQYVNTHILELARPGRNVGPLLFCMLPETPPKGARWHGELGAGLAMAPSHQRSSLTRELDITVIDGLIAGCTESRAAFKLVACAGGYASLGRQNLFPNITLNYARYVLWRGQLPEADLSASPPPPLEVGKRCVVHVTRGVGTSAARRAIKSSGSNTTSVVPSR